MVRAFSFLLAFAIALPLYAEDKTGFFSKDFAGKPVAASKKPLVEKSDRIPSAKKAVPTPAASGGSALSKETTAAAAADTPEPLVRGDDTGIEIQAIGALLSSNDTKDFQAHLDELMNLVLSKKLKLGHVYAIGNPLSYSQEENKNLRTKLWVLDGMLFELDAVPEAYKNVKLSPTWILETKDGQILLEAPRKLSDHINARGRFSEESLSLGHADSSDEKPTAF